MPNSSSQKLASPTSVPIYHKGPNLADKPLPAVIYFALSGKESLDLDPYNQPVSFFDDLPVHVFSFTLPYHGAEIPNHESVGHWAIAISKNDNVISQFISECILNIDYLINQGYIDPRHIAAAGLSRGAFIAAHLAAVDKRIQTILGYAPLTRLDLLNEFHDIQHNPIVQSLNLINVAEKLTERRLRFYIGNHDTRVSTVACFEFIKHLAELAHSKRHHSSCADLIITSSIGHKGHGTPPHIFKEGMQWLNTSLLQGLII